VAGGRGRGGAAFRQHTDLISGEDGSIGQNHSANVMAACRAFFVAYQPLIDTLPAEQ
jgi:hypothetical protein